MKDGIQSIALYNIVLISKDNSIQYDITPEDWEKFVERYSGTLTFDLSAVEREIIATSNVKPTFRQISDMYDKLTSGGSNNAEVLQNYHRINASPHVEEEDLLLMNFVDPLMMPFLKGITSTTLHGNGHPLHESYVTEKQKSRGSITSSIGTSEEELLIGL